MKDKHTDRSMMDLVGVFSFCCYRLLINFMAGCRLSGRSSVIHSSSVIRFIIYVGIDLYKETHTAVMLDCWNTKLGEITFENKPSGFPKLVRKVSRFLTEDKAVVYGLENAYGYGRALAV